MKTLIECILNNIATPMNTFGAGNVDPISSDPIIVNKKKTKNKTKNKTKMKSLNNYIYEYSTPDYVYDEVELTDNDGNVMYRWFNKGWDEKGAYPFMINIKTKTVSIGEEGSTHRDIVEYDTDGCEKKMGLNHKNYTIRIEKGEDANEFWMENPHMKNIRCGRLWDLIYSDKTDIIVIGYWEELTTAKWYSYTQKIIERYSKKEREIDLTKTKIIGIDNNGELFIMQPKEKKARLAKRSEQSNKLTKAIKAIHLASQKTKREFYADFKRSRDERNQTNKYNHTKSKTEAEYRSIRYQGDSLIDFVKNIVAD